MRVVDDAAVWASIAFLGFGSIASAQAVETAFTVQDGAASAVAYRQAERMEAGILGALRDGFFGEGGTDQIGFWAAGGGRRFDFDVAGFAGRDFGGTFGLDYQLFEDFAVGAFAGVSDTDFDTAFLGRSGALDSQAFSIGLYAGWQLLEDWAATAHIAFTRTNFDLTQGAAKGSFSSERATGAVGLLGRYALGPVVLEPQVTAALMQDGEAAYTDSLGNAIENQRVTLFRGSGGMRAVYPLRLGDVALRPYLSAAIEGSLDEVGDRSLLGDSYWGRVGAGAEAEIGPMRVTLSFDASGFGPRDYVDYGGFLQVAFALD